MKVGPWKLRFISSCWFGHSEFRCKSLTKRQIARFCEQLRMLLGSGIPLLNALGIINNMSANKHYSNIIQRISEGESLGFALKGYFPPLVISSLDGAEKAGNLEEVLTKLAKYYDNQADVEAKIKSALVYPCFVILLCFSSLIVMLVFVLPGFKTLFVDLGSDLPLFTRFFISLGDIFSKMWYIFFALFLVMAVLLSRFRRTTKGALVVDSLFLKAKFFSQEQIVHGFSTLGSLLEGGVPILEALKTTVAATKNKAFRNIVADVQANVINGEKLSDSFANHNVFPKEAIQMLAVGEGSGKLGEMLIGISSFYEKEREIFIKRVTTMLEPALTLFVGIIVGLIALALFLPMMNVISQIQ